jgi:deoxyribodipyrimidine photo-lyase
MNMLTGREPLKQRARLIRKGQDSGGPVVYWMSREQRTADNWGLLLAQHVAMLHRRALVVVFCLVPDYPGANLRHYGFMLKGLQEVEQNLLKRKIPFVLLEGDPAVTLPRYLKMIRGAFLVTDFDPLHVKRAWQKRVAAGMDGFFYLVDGHNIVPCWIASPKQEYGAYTIRPKIKKLLPDFLTDFPALKTHAIDGSSFVAPRPKWQEVLRRVADQSVSEVDWLIPGEKKARAAVTRFLREKLASYDEKRNDPTQDGQSNISPYLHFGHIAPQRTAQMASRAKADSKAKAAFLEELVTRRELADNFCYYNKNYDSFGGFPPWAQKTLDEHRADRREYLYSLEIFERAATHDSLWNAAQKQMVKMGKMHGYMRMYWAKKILEWSAAPEEAMATALYLNDRYELDGRDPGGYTGIAWSIGGVHDRAWKERPIFGKIRFMSYSGCERKFNVKRYIATWLNS